MFHLPGELSGDILCLIAAMLYADAWLKTTLQLQGEIAEKWKNQWDSPSEEHCAARKDKNSGEISQDDANLYR